MSSEPSSAQQQGVQQMQQQQQQMQQMQQQAQVLQQEQQYTSNAAQFSSQEGVRKTRRFEVKQAKKPTSPDTVEQGAGAAQTGTEPLAPATNSEKPSSAKDEASDGKVQRKGRFTVIEKGTADEAKETSSDLASVSSTPTPSLGSINSPAPPITVSTNQPSAAPAATLTHLEIPSSSVPAKMSNLSPVTSAANLLPTANSSSNLKQDLLQDQLQQIFAMNSMILQRLEHFSPTGTPSGTTPMSRRATELAMEGTAARRPESATNASARASKDKNLERLRNYLNEMRSELEQAASQRDDLETVMRTLKERNTSLERKLEEEKHKRQQLEKKLKAEQKKLNSLQSQLENAAAQNPNLRAWLAQIDGFNNTTDESSHGQLHANVQTLSHQHQHPHPHHKFASTGHMAQPIPLQFGSQPGQQPLTIVTSVPQYAQAYTSGPASTTNTTSTNGQMAKAADGSQFVATSTIDSFAWATTDNAGMDVFNSARMDMPPVSEPYAAPMPDPWSTTPIPLTTMPTTHPVVGSAAPTGALHRMTSTSDIGPPLASPIVTQGTAMDSQWSSAPMRAAPRNSISTAPQPQPQPQSFTSG